MSKKRTINAARFKAECLALLDRVNETGEEIVVTKRGQPVARLLPVVEKKRRSMLGSVEIVGDVLAPIDEPWDA